MIEDLQELVVLLSTEQEKLFNTVERDFKRVVQPHVQITTTSKPERGTGFPVRKRTGRTGMFAVAGQ